MMEPKDITTDNALEYLRSEAKALPPSYSSLCFVVLDDVAFQNGAGGSLHHHNYQFGLVQHTAEVLLYARRLSGDFRFVNYRQMVTACIWHDYMKKRDYELVLSQDNTLEPKRTPYCKLIGHVTGSAMRCAAEMDKLGFEIEQIESMLHILLAHHGQRDWGSPVTPKTPEAWILHAADMLSAQPL